MGSAVELIDDFEDYLRQLMRGSVRSEQPSNSKMGFAAQFFRNQTIGGFLDTVVEKLVGIFGTKDQPCSHRFPKLAMHLLLGVLVNDPQHGEPCLVAQAGEFLQCVSG